LPLIPDSFALQLRPGAEGPQQGDGHQVHRDPVTAADHQIRFRRGAGCRTTFDHGRRPVSHGQRGVHGQIDLGNALVPVTGPERHRWAIPRMNRPDEILQATGIFGKPMGLDDRHIDHHIGLVDRPGKIKLPEGLSLRGLDLHPGFIFQRQDAGPGRFRRGSHPRGRQVGGRGKPDDSRSIGHHHFGGPVRFGHVRHGRDHLRIRRGWRRLVVQHIGLQQHPFPAHPH